MVRDTKPRGFRRDSEEAGGGNRYELYLILSDLCNFSCAHCINTSGPQASRWNLAPDAVETLAAQINAVPGVKAVHFTGGEPSLRLPQIRQLQSLIREETSYAMTTNGWFVDRSLGLLDEFKLNELVISYDKFHRPFIEGKKLLPLIRHAQAQGTAVSVNFVFEELEDLVEAEPFVDLGVTLYSSRIILAGRAEELAVSWNDSRAIDRSCPSMDPDQRRRDDLEKIVHIPGKGFTPCCGPLAFDDQAEESFTFSAELADYETNPLRSELGKGTFRSQAHTLGIDLGDVKLRSACDACRLLYGKNSPTVPSLGQLFSQKEETCYYPSEESLGPVQESLLFQNFTVSYVHTLSPDALREATALFHGPAPAGLEALILGPGQGAESVAEVIEFTIHNYFDAFPEHYPPSAHAAFRNQAKGYFARPDVRAVAYRKSGKLVGCLYGHEYSSHPGLMQASLHVGYWGYERKDVTELQARWIRADWLRTLEQWNQGEPLQSARMPALMIDASIACYNAPALRFIKKLGFAQRLLRLDRKAKS